MFLYRVCASDTTILVMPNSKILRIRIIHVWSSWIFNMCQTRQRHTQLNFPVQCYNYVQGVHAKDSAHLELVTLSLMLFVFVFVSSLFMYACRCLCVCGHTQCAAYKKLNMGTEWPTPPQIVGVDWTWLHSLKPYSTQPAGVLSEVIQYRSKAQPAGVFLQV